MCVCLHISIYIQGGGGGHYDISGNFKPHSPLHM